MPTPPVVVLSDDYDSETSKAFVASVSKFKFYSPRTTGRNLGNHAGLMIGSASTISARKRTRPIENSDEEVEERTASVLALQKSSPSAKKGKKRAKTGYEPPETFAHLSGLPDRIRPGLDILFCGINPGTVSAARGFHFAHPNNQFYRALHESGLTDRRLPPHESSALPELYNMGLTDIVARPSTNSGQLSIEEKIAGVPDLLRKIDLYKPRIVCFIGKEVAAAMETAVKRHLRGTTGLGTGRQKKAEAPKKASSARKGKVNVKSPTYQSPLVNGAEGFRFIAYKMSHNRVENEVAEGSTLIKETLFFTSPSTSGLVTQYRIEDRVQLFKLLKEERDALIESSQTLQDTSEFVIIPHSLYEVSGTP